MASELCEFYGWTIEYCLRLPARTFFAMHREVGRLIRIRTANKFKDLCFVAGYVQSDYEDRLAIIKYFDSRLDEPLLKDKPVLEPEEAKQVLMGMFGMYRRSLGY